jgi:hypothetical protein
MADPVTEFELYREEILAALGGRDPVAVLGATVDEVDRLASGVDADRLRRSPGPGEWSPWQVLSHLHDSDLVAAVRLRMIVSQERPVLVGYDQEAWAARFAGLDPEPGETVARWAALRRSNLRLLASLTPSEWERIGLHTERGEESVRLIVSLLAGHDVVHLDQLRRGLVG